MPRPRGGSPRRQAKLDPPALDARGGEKKGFGRIEPEWDFADHDPVRLDMSEERPGRQDKIPLRSTGLRQLPQPRCEVGEKTAVGENGFEIGDEKLVRPVRRSAIHRSNAGAQTAAKTYSERGNSGGRPSTPTTSTTEIG